MCFGIPFEGVEQDELMFLTPGRGKGLPVLQEWRPGYAGEALN